MADILHITDEGTVNNNDWVNGGSSTETDRMMAQTFKTTADITCSKVVLVFSNQASNTDNVTLRIETTSGGAPTGTLANANATVTVAGAGISGYVNQSTSRVTFTFATPFALSNGVQYAIVVSKSGGNVNDCYAWLIQTNSTYPDGHYWSYSGGSWGNGSEGGSALFSLYEQEAPLVATTNQLKFYRRTRFPGSITGL